MAEEPKYVSRATERDVVSFIYSCFNNYGWKTSFNYLTFKPKHFFSKPLIIPERSRLDFSKYVEYCFLLSNTFTDKDDVAKYKNNYGTSIYFSAVLYWLLIHYGVLSEKGLKFCQGYYRYKTKDGSKFRAGMHTWLTFYGSVIDVTIWQEQDNFDFNNSAHTSIIAGNIPKGLNLAGFEEDKSLIKEYARRFAKDSGFTFHDWLSLHKHQADSLLSLQKNQP